MLGGRGTFAWGLALAATVGAQGCTYQTVTTSPEPAEIYSSFEEQVPGSYALAVDGRRLAGTFSPLGLACGMADFPIDAAAAFESAMAKTLGSVVSRVAPAGPPPAPSDLEGRGLAAVITVLGEELDAQLDISPGMLLVGEAEARSRVTASFTAEGAQGRLLGGTVIGEGSGRSGSGPGCSGGAAALAEATAQAISSAARQIGERISDSQWLRAAGARPIPVPIAPAMSP